MTSLDEIIKNSLCFTHGGNLASLYGVIATQKISSANALIAYGDNFQKFTDPNKEFTQEDNYLFFESKADRGNLSYASLVSSGVGFAYLLVKSADTLLSEVDMIASSDGVLVGRSDDNPLEISLDNSKILIPDCYKEEILGFCDKLKDLGHNTLMEKLIFKPLEQINKLLRKSQSDFCQSIGLEAKVSEKIFSSQKLVETKTSKIYASCSEPLEYVSIKEKNLTKAQDLVAHMKARPTLANIQRNSFILLKEQHSHSLYKEIYKENKAPLILDLIDKPADLAFILNSFVETHYETRAGKKIGYFELSRIKNRLSSNELSECLDIAVQRKITAQDCYNVFNKPVWHIAINRQQLPPANVEQIKSLINLNPEKEILVWKQGMSQWENARELTDFSHKNIFNNIQNIRANNTQKNTIKPI